MVALWWHRDNDTTYFMYFGMSVVPVFIKLLDVMSPSVGSSIKTDKCDCSISAVRGLRRGVP